MGIGLILSLAIVGTSIVKPARPLLPLWPLGNPGGWTRSDKEVVETAAGETYKILRSVSQPTLEIFLAKKPLVGAPTLLVCPGGGYWVEAIEHEGWEMAEFLNQSGINAAVLKYRLPNRDVDKPLCLAPLQDAQRAIRLLRAHAVTYHINPDRIGILGFSAGGHLAAATSVEKTETYKPTDATDQLSARPNFTALIYAAYLDSDGKPELTNDLKVDASTPPAFAVMALDDGIPVESSMAYARACRDAKVPMEMHIFPKGGHGYGLRSHEPRLKTWPDLLVAWTLSLYPASK